MLKMSECTRKTTCYDCDNTNCFWSKKKIADCPKMECDNDDKYACNNCKFIDKFIEEERKIYMDSHDCDTCKYRDNTMEMEPCKSCASVSGICKGWEPEGEDD